MATLGVIKFHNCHSCGILFTPLLTKLQPAYEFPVKINLFFRTFEEVVFQALAETINATMAKALIQLPEDQVPYEEIRAKFHRYLDNGMRTGRRYLMPASILARSSYGYLLAHWYRYFPREQVLVVDGNDLKGEILKQLKRV